MTVHEEESSQTGIVCRNTLGKLKKLEDERPIKFEVRRLRTP
jgi:hypothetical protein